MGKTLSAAEAKAQFADCLRSAERGDAVFVTRHGRAVAAIVAAAEVQELDRLRKAGPGGGLASLAGGWQGSEDLFRALSGSKRGRKRRRPPAD